MKIVQLIVMFLLLLPLVFGLSIAPGEPYYPQPNPQVNQQFYTVLLDGEGEATFAAKIVIVNNGREPLETLRIEIPGKVVRMINSFQESKSLVPQCADLERICTSGEEKVCMQYGSNGACTFYQTVKNPCIKQEEKCNRMEMVYDWPLLYTPVMYAMERLSESTVYTFNLPASVPQFETVTLLLYYKVSEVAQKSIGVWSGMVETVKVAYDMENIRVSVNVVPDFYLKGQESRVDYRPGFFAAAEMKLVAQAPNQELGDFSRSIEYYSGYVKESKALDPWESMQVDVAYSSSRLLLRGWQLVIGLVVVGLIGMVLGFAIKKYRNMTRKQETNPVMKIVVTGGISAFAIYLLVFSARWMMDNLYSLVDYQMQGVIGMMTFLFVAVSILAVIVIPPLYYSMHFGVWHGVAALGATLFFIFAIGVIIVMIFTNTMYSPPVFMAEVMGAIK